MADTQFRVTIPNLPKLQQALASYPAIATPIIQNAIVAAQAILAKFTTAATVPIRTGYLVQNWAFEIGNLMARWYPKAAYAPFVEFGTAPHIIKAVNARVLANKQTGEVFGPIVHHPGTKSNPFMERIVAAAQPDIDTLFVSALDKVTAQIASQANG
jgi:hypothetical protein